MKNISRSRRWRTVVEKNGARLILWTQTSRQAPEWRWKLRELPRLTRRSCEIETRHAPQEGEPATAVINSKECVRFLFSIFFRPFWKDKKRYHRHCLELCTLRMDNYWKFHHEITHGCFIFVSSSFNCYCKFLERGFQVFAGSLRSFSHSMITLQFQK